MFWRIHPGFKGYISSSTGEGDHLFQKSIFRFRDDFQHLGKIETLSGYDHRKPTDELGNETEPGQIVRLHRVEECALTGFFTLGIANFCCVGND